MDLVSNVSTVLESDDVDGPLLFILRIIWIDKLLCMDKRFSFSGSEDESLEAVNIFRIDNSCHSFNINGFISINKAFVLFVVSSALNILSDHLLVKMRDKLVGGDKYLIGILQVVECCLTLLEPNILFFYEFSLLIDVFLDLFQQ